jgi:hypothetical protein
MKKSGLADSPFFDTSGQKKSAPPPGPPNKRKRTKPVAEKETKVKPQVEDSTVEGSTVDQSTDQSTSRPTGRPIDQSTDQLTDESTNIDALGPVVARPRAFYITQKLDRWLDEAVTYLKGKGMHKVDRSVLINALLHDPSLFESRSLDRIRPSLLTHLTNKFLRRGQSTE